MCISKSSVYYGECSFIVEVSEIETLWFSVKRREKWRLSSTLHFVDNEWFISSHQSFIRKLCTRCNVHWLHNNRPENQAFPCTRYSGSVTVNVALVISYLLSHWITFRHWSVQMKPINLGFSITTHIHCGSTHVYTEDFLYHWSLLGYDLVWLLPFSLMPWKVKPTAS